MARLDPHVHQLHRIVIGAMAIGARVLGSEAFRQVAQCLPGLPIAVECQTQLERLADVAQIGRPTDLQPPRVMPLPSQRLARTLLQLAINRFQTGYGQFVASPQQRARHVVRGLGREQPERTEQTWRRRHHHAADAQLVGGCNRVQRTITAVGDEREGARIAAALRGDRAHSSNHVGNPDPMHTVGGLQRIQRERPGHPLHEQALCPLGVERQLST